jgi:predicted secreted Zn-dependent protease
MRKLQPLKHLSVRGRRNLTTVGLYNWETLFIYEDTYTHKIKEHEESHQKIRNTDRHITKPDRERGTHKEKCNVENEAREVGNT